MDAELDLAVGDIAVYGGHGVARVVVRGSKDMQGELREFVVFECSRGLSVTLPLERARSALRRVVTEEEIRDIRAALCAERSTSSDSWQRRLKATRAKVAGGRAVELAEVVRDAELRGHWLKDRGATGGLSTNERQLYRRARQLLTDELGVSRGLEPAEAEAWIDAQLARTPA
jgi:CarD family transcriptional regulator